MAADYRVRFSGEDNLSGTINNIKQKLKETGLATSELDRIMERFNRITNSAAPLKKQLRDIQSLMALMNMSGLTNTSEFTEIAQLAGKLKDAIDDASQAVRLYSSDTMTLEAGVQAFQGLAAAGTIATGVMGLLGTENEKVNEAILKVQSALAILNGVQSIANVLNKDSALILKLKATWEGVVTAATASNTRITTLNTAAVGANTLAMRASTVAMRAWNIAKAIGSALLGNWAALVLVGAAGLATYAMATSKSTEELEKKNKALKDGIEAEKNYSKQANDTYGRLMANYTNLRIEWNQLKTEHEKADWIKNNVNAFNELGLSINTIVDAENALNGNTNAVVENIKKIAKAAALRSRLLSLYTEQADLLSQQDSVEGLLVDVGLRRHKVLQERSKNVLVVRLKLKEQGQRLFRPKPPHVIIKANEDLTKIDKENNRLWEQLKLLTDKSIGIQHLMEAKDKEINKIAEELGELTVPTGKSGKQSTSTRTTPTVKKQEALPGSINDLQDKLSTILNNLRNGVIPEELIELSKKKMEELTKSIEDLEIHLGLRKPLLVDKKFEDGSIASIKEAIKKIEDRLENENLDIYARKFLIADKEALENQIKELEGTLPPVKTKLDLVGDSENAIYKILLKREFRLIDYDGAVERIKAINTDLIRLGAKPFRVHIETDFELNFNLFADDANNVISSFEGIDNVVSSISSLVDALDEGANAWEVFMGIVNVVNSTIQGVGNTLTAVTTIMDILNTSTAAAAATSAAAAQSEVANSAAVTTAKSGEAIAGATASGAKMPFPLNLVAIALGIAAVIAALATTFADGGTVKGSTFHGDKVLARLNAGEMVLNLKLQGNLFNILNNGVSGGGAGLVEFFISGSNLKGVLRNYDNKISKIH